MPREQLLKNKTWSGTSIKTNNRISVFSAPYSVEFKHISNIINKYILVLHADPALQCVLSDGFRQVARKAPTHANILSPSLIKSAKSKNPKWLHYPGCFKCSHSRCICCNYIEVSIHFTSVVMNKYAVKQYFNCNTTYVVYLITCDACATQYVGSTTYTLKTRIRRHLSDVNNVNFNQMLAVSAHCAQVHDRSTATFRIQGIERVNIPDRGGDHVRKLHSRETFWIFMLQTCQPKGMNKRLDLDLHY